MQDRREMSFCGQDKRSLLIVDDDARYRAFVAEAFERAGFVTRQAWTERLRSMRCETGGVRDLSRAEGRARRRSAGGLRHR
jgi:hypothetical protein